VGADDAKDVDDKAGRKWLGEALAYNIDHVKYCQHCFSFDMPSKLWQKRVEAFEDRFSEMYLCAFR